MFQSYEELMSLSEKGSHLPLDLTSADMTAKSEDKPKQESTRNPPENDDNAYAAFAKLPPRPVFLWGKAVNKGTQSVLLILLRHTFGRFPKNFYHPQQ